MHILRNLFRQIFEKKKMIVELAKADFRKRFVGSYFGVVWMFVQPIVTILIYFCIFQLGFKSVPPVPGVPYEKIDEFCEFIAKAGLVTGGTGSKVRPVVACKGTTCQYGLLDSFGLSEEIHHRFYEGYRQVLLPHKFKIAVGGCPNNCVKPDLNDLGIIGQRIPNYDPDECNGCKKCAVEKACPIHAAKLVDGVMEIDHDACNNCGRCVGTCPFDCIEDGTYGYKIYIGGRWGKSVAHGRALSKVFTDKEEALSVIEKAILLYREQGHTGERFAATIERIGFENVEAQLLSDDILARKQEILDAQLHLTGGATC